MTVVVFALSNQTAPTSVTPYAQRLSGLRLKVDICIAWDAVLRHTADWPLFARLDGQAGSTKKCNGCFDQLGIHGYWQRRQGRFSDSTWIAVECSNQKAHVLTKWQADIILHLLVFVSPKCSETFSTIPKRFAQR
ncbi:hypothetical protein FQZ97_825800 [compost metagenome]